MEPRIGHSTREAYPAVITQDAAEAADVREELKADAFSQRKIASHVLGSAESTQAPAPGYPADVDEVGNYIIPVSPAAETPRSVPQPGEIGYSNRPAAPQVLR